VKITDAIRLHRGGAIRGIGIFLPILFALFAAVAFAQTPLPLQKRDTLLGPKPDWSWLPQLRILTEADYPPFNYYDEDGQLAGFNIDLARAICRELAVPCEVNTAEWSGLIPALKSNEADAVFASIAISAKALKDIDFSSRYYATPARFAGKTGKPAIELTAGGLAGVKVAVVKGTAHEAFLRDFFGKAQIQTYATAADARNALKSDQADLLFGDGISLMFWIQGTDSNRCCEFKGEGYLEPRYFGEGVGIAIRRGNLRLREVLDYALTRVKASGRYEELMLRYFPLPLY